MMQQIAISFFVFSSFLQTLAFADDAPDQPSELAKLRLLVPTTRFGGVDLMLIDGEGKNAVQITHHDQPCYQPSWSPDGSQFVMMTFEPSKFIGQLLIAGKDGTGIRSLAAPAGGLPNPAWSPDGKRIAFEAHRGGNQEIVCIDVDGKNEVNLTNSPLVDTDPSWSPDGGKIAFASNRQGHFRLFVMNSDGTNQTDLLQKNLLTSVYPMWSADGKQIVFGGMGDNRTVQLFIVNADGTGMQQLTQGVNLNSYGAWSPDNNYIAYIRYPWAPRDTPRTPIVGADLMIYDVINDTHTLIGEREIPTNGPRPAWMPIVAGK